LIKKEVQKEVKVDMEAFIPMTNIIPTIKSEKAKKPKFKRLSNKAKQSITPDDLNLEDIAALPTKHDKVIYLAMHGWSLKIEQRGKNFYHYATKYINRKKKRYYLGSINE
jgi:phage terminase large subunit-like protein